MSHIDVGRDVTGEPSQPIVDVLMIVCCLPAVLISGVVLALAGGFKPGFFFPALVVGGTLGMLMYVSLRDRGRI